MILHLKNIYMLNTMNFTNIKSIQVAAKLQEQNNMHR